MAKIVSLVAAFILGVVGTVAALSIVRPWVTLSELETTNPGDPFALQVVFRNEGPLPIHNIRVRCTVFYIQYPGSRLVNTSFEDLKDIKQALKPRHQTHSKCAPSVDNREKATKAALAIAVSFEPYYLPWEWRKEEPPFIYTLERDQNHQIRWLPEG